MTTKDQLLKRLDTMLGQAEREHGWGQIEIELREGEPTLLRQTKTERLDNNRERTRDQYNIYR